MTVKPRNTILPEAERGVLLGVRPEHITLVSDRNNADIELKATAVETLAHGYPAGGDVHSGELVARLPGGVHVADGNLLPLAINPGMAHIFDTTSGRRV